jgi:hypothetical protein
VADENAATFDFLLDNGMIFDERPPTIENGGTVPRLFVTKPYSDNLNETINGSPGSGLVRHLEASARGKALLSSCATRSSAELTVYNGSLIVSSNGTTA